MAKRDYYELLGVSKDADKETIKKAYRELAKKYHPDRNKGDQVAEKKFKDINEAYDILKDDKKRVEYDRYGHQAFEGGMAGRTRGDFSGFDFHFGGSGFPDFFGEMFNEFMGGNTTGTQEKAKQAQKRGADQRHNLQITLEEAFEGKQTQVTLQTQATCHECKGTGSEKGTRVVKCSHCDGMGKTRMQQGFFMFEKTCATCHGEGRIIKSPCRTCHGSGLISKTKTLQISIPKGVEDGTRIRLTGEGAAGMRGGPPGDLYIFLTVKPHARFKRNGMDLSLQLKIPMVTATLGGNINVTTISQESVPLNVPAGTQSQTVMRLRGHGMSALRGIQRGDLLVTVIVETPTNLTQTQKKLLREFEKSLDTSKKTPQKPSSFPFWKQK